MAIAKDIHTCNQSNFATRFAVSYSKLSKLTDEWLIGLVDSSFCENA